MDKLSPCLISIISCKFLWGFAELSKMRHTEQCVFLIWYKTDLIKRELNIQVMALVWFMCPQICTVMKVNGLLKSEAEVLVNYAEPQQAESGTRAVMFRREFWLQTQCISKRTWEKCKKGNADQKELAWSENTDCAGAKKIYKQWLYIQPTFAHFYCIATMQWYT